MDVPNVRGLVVGRALLYPPDGDVAAAIDRAARIVRPMNRHRPARDAGWPAATRCALTPERAGWARSGLRVLRLAGGETRTIETGDDEVAVLPLSITGLTVDVDGERFELAGRTDVFARVTDFVYVGRDSTVTLRATGGGEVAVPTARCERRLPPRYGPAEDVPVEVRGAGRLHPPGDQLPQPRVVAARRPADGRRAAHPGRQLVVVPAAPPRRLAGVPGEQRGDLLLPHRRRAMASALHRLYTSGRRRSTTPSSSRDGDVFLIPRGYHGPCIAAPGHTMYYLNVLAGPGGERSMAFCDDPAHHWVRESWAEHGHRSAAPDRVMPERRAIGIGVIGFGWMGQAHSRVVPAHPDAVPRAHVRAAAGRRAPTPSRPAARRRCRRSASRRPSDDWRRVVEHPDVDVVTVTAPNMLHEQLVRRRRRGRQAPVLREAGRRHARADGAHRCGHPAGRHHHRGRVQLPLRAARDARPRR